MTRSPHSTPDDVRSAVVEIDHQIDRTLRDSLAAEVLRRSGTEQMYALGRLDEALDAISRACEHFIDSWDAVYAVPSNGEPS